MSIFLLVSHSKYTHTHYSYVGKFTSSLWRRWSTSADGEEYYYFVYWWKVELSRPLELLLAAGKDNLGRQRLKRLSAYTHYTTWHVRVTVQLQKQTFRISGAIVRGKGKRKRMDSTLLWHVSRQCQRLEQGLACAVIRDRSRPKSALL